MSSTLRTERENRRETERKNERRAERRKSDRVTERQSSRDVSCVLSKPSRVCRQNDRILCDTGVLTAQHGSVLKVHTGGF